MLNLIIPLINKMTELKKPLEYKLTPYKILIFLFISIKFLQIRINLLLYNIQILLLFPFQQIEHKSEQKY